MAKKETIKKEKLVDLTPKKEKITDTELNRLQSTVKTVDHLVTDIGQLELRKFSLMKAMDKVQNDLEILRKEFQDSYGTDNINIQTGAIAYPEKNQTPNPEENPTQITQENGETDKKD